MIKQANIQEIYKSKAARIRRSSLWDRKSRVRLYPLNIILTSFSALYFDSPEGFGDWTIVIHEGAEKELRFRHKKDQKTFNIIVKKIKCVAQHST